MHKTLFFQDEQIHIQKKQESMERLMQNVLEELSHFPFNQYGTLILIDELLKDDKHHRFQLHHLQLAEKLLSQSHRGNIQVNPPARRKMSHFFEDMLLMAQSYLDDAFEVDPSLLRWAHQLVEHFQHLQRHPWQKETKRAFCYAMFSFTREYLRHRLYRLRLMAENQLAMA